jgi:hypothetical protein
MKVLLVVIVIGDYYLDLYEKFFRKSHEIYSKKHGYDFRVVTNMLDYSVNHASAFSFQKILVCSQEWSNDYDYIVCIDADIIINPNSPPIHECCDFKEKIGIINENAQPTPEIWEKCHCTPNDYYRKVKGFEDLDTQFVLNTGVMVLQPKIHADFLRKVFDKYVQGCITTNLNGYHYEQIVVGYEMQKNNLFILLPNKWNNIWGVSKYTQETSHISMEQFFHENYLYILLET